MFINRYSVVYRIATQRFLYILRRSWSFLVGRGATANSRSSALYHEPKILILDEATSSLESQSEQYIQKRIQRLREDQKRIIIIAHRLITVVHADEIVALENGKVVESGTHKQLIKEKGNYYSLWQQQALNL